ncbi:MAG TPA: tRNA lysidine(34) synthetase TilS [Thermoanaerobaculia bacterium]|nr:tRNA lysidine(34) synthetase TilS [Thermoanaerobaculia bacterium]
MTLTTTLERFFEERAPLAEGEGVLVAFSGGVDSSALLLGMAGLAARRNFRVHAAHLDHGMDAGSAVRAAAAARTAEGIGVPFLQERREVRRLRRGGESWEEAGRRVRYGFLEEMREAVGARWIATAHHRDDQAETVLVRMRQGSGVTGLGGIRAVQGRVVRPLLEVSRAVLAAAVRGAGIAALDDPTNRDLAAARNLVRHRLLPALAGEDPEVAARLAGLAAAAQRAEGAIARRLAPLLDGTTAVPGGVAVRAGELFALPDALLPFALAALHRRAGAPHPAGGAARRELLRQLGRGARVGCDCGRGWRWERRRELLVLRRAAAATAPRAPSAFAYTLGAPAHPERRPPGSSGPASR